MNYIFDFDGTICDSINQSVNTVNKVLVKHGINQTTVSEIKQIGLKGLVHKSKIPQEKLDLIVTEYRELSKNNYAYLKPINNIEPVLKMLKKKNKLGILTTNKVENVEMFLTKNKLEYFDFIRSEEDVFSKDIGLIKIFSDFGISPKETFFIGDETRDIDAAKKAGAFSISVTWGAESKKLLALSNPYKIISMPEELLHIT